MRRFALLAFGAAFAVIFVLVASVEGIGRPDVPPGAAAIVEGVRGEAGTITQAELLRGLDQYAAFDGKEDPREGRYSYYRERGLEALLEAAWTRGAAEELDISITPEEVADETKRLRAENFDGEADYRGFLAESQLTNADVEEQLETRLLGEAVLEQTAEDPPQPTDREIEEYYEAALSTRFTETPVRDVRVITSTRMQDIIAAKRSLEEDSSAGSWTRVARRYSIDPASSERGGLTTGLDEGAAEEPLNAAMFAAPENRIEGPVTGGEGRIYVFEVVRANPERVQPLDEVRDEVVSQLESQAREEASTKSNAVYEDIWTSRTYCAPRLAIDECGNFEDDGHPADAPPACYESNPKRGRPEACPAPVTQLIPALPGSVTPAEPGGTPLAQRPRPSRREDL